jgi:hypothetical protein
VRRFGPAGATDVDRRHQCRDRRRHPSAQAGRQAAPSRTTADGEADEKKDRPTYEWEGTIRVENRYNDAKYGRCRWQAEYRVKFLEANPEGPYPSPDNGRLISNNRLEPLELAYEYRADQAWQVWLNDDLMKTISMHGQASGHSQSSSPDKGLSYRAQFGDSMNRGPSRIGHPPKPGGWYHFDIEIWGTETERRALYDGIERGGTDHLDANRNFLDNIPVCMPTPTWITGRLVVENPAAHRRGFSIVAPSSLHHRDGAGSLSGPCCRY